MARRSNLLRGSEGEGGGSDDLPGLWSMGRHAETDGGGDAGVFVESCFSAWRGDEAGMGAGAGELRVLLVPLYTLHKKMRRGS